MVSLELAWDICIPTGQVLTILVSASLFYFQVMQSYTAMRKAREEFREKLVKLICQEAPGDDGDGIPSGEEKNMLRYYYYLRYGIDTIHVAPLDNKILLR